MKTVIDTSYIERIKQLEEENKTLKQRILKDAQVANTTILREQMKYNILRDAFADVKRRLALLELLAR